MVIFPACKINLGLSVKERRSDGFHNVETILFPIPLRDALEIIPGGERVRFTMSGIALDNGGKDNLVMKAYRLIDQRFGIGPVRVHLHKAIPAGAGLGGGSSDAAHTLTMLNDMFGLQLSSAELETLARELGTDCAFFIQNQPQLAYGKGDQFEPLDLRLEGYRILLVKPPVHINTATAYGWITPRPRKGSVKDIVRSPPEQWRGNLVNDFEQPVFHRHPELADIKQRILELGAAYASMTGSGSALFGIYRKDMLPAAPADFPGCFVWRSPLC